MKFGTLTTIEHAHITADMKYSVYPVVKIAARPKDGKMYRSDQSSEREKQIYLGVNKTDCDTADSKQENR